MHWDQLAPDVIPSHSLALCPATQKTCTATITTVTTATQHRLHCLMQINLYESSLKPRVNNHMTAEGITTNCHSCLRSLQILSFHLRALRYIRSLLTEDMGGSIATAMVLSYLNYTNSLLFGCLAFNIVKLQCIYKIPLSILLTTDVSESHNTCPACPTRAAFRWASLSVSLHRL